MSASGLQSPPTALHSKLSNVLFLFYPPANNLSSSFLLYLPFDNAHFTIQDIAKSLVELPAPPAAYGESFNLFLRGQEHDSAADGETLFLFHALPGNVTRCHQLNLSQASLGWEGVQISAGGAPPFSTEGSGGFEHDGTVYMFGGLEYYRNGTRARTGPVETAAARNVVSVKLPSSGDTAASSSIIRRRKEGYWPPGAAGHSVTRVPVLGDSAAVVLGGNSRFDRAHVLRPGEDPLWKQVAIEGGEMVQNRTGHTAVLAPGGQSLLVLGGWTGNENVPAEPRLLGLDMRNGEGPWSWVVPQEQSFRSGLWGHAAAMVGDVMVVTGGNVANGQSWSINTDVFLYDGVRGMWLVEYNSRTPGAAQMDTAVVVGVAIGGSVLIAAIMGISWFAPRRRRKQAGNSNGSMSTKPTDIEADLKESPDTPRMPSSKTGDIPHLDLSETKAPDPRAATSPVEQNENQDMEVGTLGEGQKVVLETCRAKKVTISREGSVVESEDEEEGYTTADEDTELVAMERGNVNGSWTFKE